MDEHDFVMFQPLDGLWCAQCGLSKERWITDDCGGDAAELLVMLGPVLAETNARNVARSLAAFSFSRQVAQKWRARR